MRPNEAGGLLEERPEAWDLLDGFAAWSADASRWSHEDRERLRPHVLRVAAATLTELQLEYFTRAIAGETTTQIAASRDPPVSRQAVEAALFGGARGGAVKRLKQALSEDPDFIAVVRSIDDRREAVDEAPALLRWYACLVTPAKPELFVGLAVLMLACKLRDAQGYVSTADLYRYAPRLVVDHGLASLKLTGYVLYDGRRVRVVRTPVDAPKEAA